MTTLEEIYLKTLDDEKVGLIPDYEVMGNEILADEFNGDKQAVYAYCIENETTWSEVLGYKYDKEVLY